MSNKDEGFTLIEVVITLAVFTIGIVASFSLAIANLNNARDNFNRVLATNLAREGIELIRSTRDSNWLRTEDNEICGTAPADYICNWDEGLKEDFVYMDYLDTTPVSYSNCAVGSSMSACLNTCVGDGECGLYQNVDNYYVHDGTNARFTGMYRLIKIGTICQNNTTGEERIGDGSLSCTALTETKIGIEAISNVQWGDRSMDNTVEIRETFYNWRM